MVRIVLIAFSCIIIWAHGGCSTVQGDQQKRNCPDSIAYFSKIETIRLYYYYSDSSSKYRTVRFDSLQHRFALDLDYLFEITGLPSHVSSDYDFGYFTEQDYQSDIDQYSKWYGSHCR